MAASLCDLATRLPALIATLLDGERSLKRGRFREETCTDFFTSSLAAFAGPELVIQYPPETDTGGDLDLEFWNVRGSRRLRLRIQAKRLSAEREGSRMVGVRARSYRELLHEVNSPEKYQFRTLLQEADPAIPLYMFYNHASVVGDPYFASRTPRVSGINLAFAYDIARQLEAKLDAAAETPPRMLHHKRLDQLQHLFFKLDAILCPPGDWEGASVPTPDAVGASLLEIWDQISRLLPDDEAVMHGLVRPTMIEYDYDGSSRMPDGPAFRLNRGLDRPRVTFISGRTDDRRTPRITAESPQG